MKFLLLPLVVVLCLTALSCTEESGESATPTSEEESTTVASSDADGGGVITEAGPVALTVGGRATIELATNPTTGYQWELATEPDTTIVSVVSDEYTAAEAADGMVGTGGIQKVVLQGVAAGTTTIELRYVRPWETDRSGAETATFAVTVS